MDASMRNMTSLPWRSKKDKWCWNIPQVPNLWSALLRSILYVYDLNLVHCLWLSVLLGTGESSTQVTPFLPGGVSDGNWHTVHIHYYNKVGLNTTFSVFSTIHILSFISPFGPCFDIMKQTAAGGAFCCFDSLKKHIGVISWNWTIFWGCEMQGINGNAIHLAPFNVVPSSAAKPHLQKPPCTFGSIWHLYCNARHYGSRKEMMGRLFAPWLVSYIQAMCIVFFFFNAFESLGDLSWDCVHCSGGVYFSPFYLYIFTAYL